MYTAYKLKTADLPKMVAYMEKFGSGRNCSKLFHHLGLSPADGELITSTEVQEAVNTMVRETESEWQACLAILASMLFEAAEGGYLVENADGTFRRGPNADETDTLA